jgi:3-oxoacyl-[acyl-carrier protein] reductase
MDTGLADKVVLITGASGGIGRAVADRFHAEGATLVLQGHGRFDELAALAAGGRFGSAPPLCLRADVAEAADVDALFAQALDAHGRVDVCIANAGIWPRGDVPLARMDPARLARTVATNLLGAAWTARAFTAALERTGPRADGHGASIVFTGSTAARFGERGHADYALAKAGLQGLVRTLKNEIVAIDPYARANVVEPGWTVTEMVRAELADDAVVQRVTATMALQQLARARDVANAIAFLASPLLARHVTGETLCVSGGMEGRLLHAPDGVNAEAVRRRLKGD